MPIFRDYQEETSVTAAMGTAAGLLGLDTKPVHGEAAKQFINGKTVLITGAGGSIGSEIARQLLELKAQVVCLDNNEYALYRLERELSGSALLVDDKYVLADIRDGESLRAVFAHYKPQIVFHAAACKHLPLLERSPAMAILTNILGTENVVSACVEQGVECLVNVSTDKAANPTSVLGISKRLAEMIVKQNAGRGTRVASVRFGNVFASRGSFIETFVWQIANDHKVTITDPAMTRYFMTIPQAASLVIETAAMADGGDTYVLDMGESFGIVELMQRYAELAGIDQLDVIYTGLRQGEKLSEEPFDSQETRRPTTHPAISTVSVDEGGTVSTDKIVKLYRDAQSGVTASELRDKLTNLIDTQLPTPTAKV